MPLSKIVANSIADDTITTDQIADTSVHGRRNLLINGAQQISQRGTSFTGQGANGSPYFTDRWYAFSGGTSAGRFTATQEAITDLSGFTQALKLDCTTADTSIGADEQLALIQAVEAQTLQHLKFGTSDAVPLTYSFYAKANAAKNYITELYAIDGSAKSQSHAFNVTTSWQRFEITFSATGADAATIDNNDGVGLYVLIALHAGSNLSSGTINSTWAAATQANRHVGCDSFYSSTDNTFFFTGAQLEVGSQASPFEHRSFAEELALCQRYYYNSTFANAGSNGYSSAPLHLYHAYQKNANHWEWTKATHPVTMRGTPGMTTVDGNGNSGKITHWTSQGGAVSHNHTPYTANAKGGNASVSEYSSSIWGFYCNYIADSEL